MYKSLILFFALLINTAVFAQKPDAIVGTWLPSNGKVHIKIENISNKYFGTIIWLEEPNDPTTKKPKIDKKNPEKNQQNKPMLGLKIVKDLVFDDNEWVNGTVYDPESGKVYKCTVTLKDANTMDLRGYIGFSFIGKSDIWKRVK